MKNDKRMLGITSGSRWRTKLLATGTNSLIRHKRIVAERKTERFERIWEGGRRVNAFREVVTVRQTSFHLDLRAPCASGLDERGHQLRPVLRWRRAQGEEVGGQHLWVLCVRFLTDNREEKTLALLSNIFRRAHHIHIYVLCKYFANKTHADDDDDDDHTHRENMMKGKGNTYHSLNAIRVLMNLLVTRAQSKRLSLSTQVSC